MQLSISPAKYESVHVRRKHEDGAHIGIGSRPQSYDLLRGILYVHERFAVFTIRQYVRVYEYFDEVSLLEYKFCSALHGTVGTLHGKG